MTKKTSEPMTKIRGSKTDACRVFEKMLNSGHPPDSWDNLLKEAKGDLDRLNEISKKLLD